MAGKLEDWLSKQEYSGRGIEVGATHDVLRLRYWVTARSEPSQARFLSDGLDTVRVDVTDPKALAKGNPALLLYPCFRNVNGMYVVSNGAQTDLVARWSQANPNMEPKELLRNAFAHPHYVDGPDGPIDIAAYEPDGPTYTPRITLAASGDQAAFCIVRRAETGKAVPKVMPFALKEGKSKALMTYTGRNVPSGQPIPVFEGNKPLGFRTETKALNPKAHAESLYKALQPKTGEGVVQPEAEFRVGVLAIDISPRYVSGTIIDHRNGNRYQSNFEMVRR